MMVEKNVDLEVLNLLFGYYLCFLIFEYHV